MILQLYDEFYAKRYLKEFQKMPVEKVIKLREKSLFQREWMRLTQLIILFLFSVISLIAFVFSFFVYHVSIEILANPEVLGVFLAILPGVLLVFLCLAHRKKLQDKVIDEMLSKRKEPLVCPTHPK